MGFNVYNDATECITKEGNKTYEYGWLDKVLKVTENGKTLADFEQHNNGQIAKAIRPDKTENFLWDGLALVKRDDTKFINEPHAGGGNPVLAIQDVDADKSKAIFTDMRGTSLGSTVEDQYNNISKTSLLGLGTEFSGLATKGIEQERFLRDGQGEGQMINGVYYLTFDIDSVKSSMKDYIFNDK